VLEDFRSFYFDTALSSSPAALPTLLAFAKPGHVLYGSDWPFAPAPAAQYFANGLTSFALDAGTGAAIDHRSAWARFPRLAAGPSPAPERPPLAVTARRTVQRAVARAAFRLVQP
jgi:6-methylsalicylate decarboxylase